MSDQASQIQIVGGDQEETDPKKILEKLPTVKIYWDEKKHDVAVHFEAAEFRSFSFLVHVLERAKQMLEQTWAMRQQEQAQQAVIDQVQAAAMAENLRRGPRMNGRN